MSFSRASVRGVSLPTCHVAMPRPEHPHASQVHGGGLLGRQIGASTWDLILSSEPVTTGLRRTPWSSALIGDTLGVEWWSVFARGSWNGLFPVCSITPLIVELFSLISSCESSLETPFSDT